ncbi:TetR/AcrR family transcriptional regulator [Bacillus tianshenii]|nr:TetR/AcrR family transcriptional regulator [Bacillus tianshenii]
MNLLEKSLDPRIKRTRGYLRKALIELINEKGFEGITVKDLTERAEINRATFYQHYKDKYDLLEQSMDEIIEALVETVLPESFEEIFMNMQSLERLFERLFTYVAEHADFYKVMLGDRGIPAFRNKLLLLIRSNLNKVLASLEMTEDALDIPKDILLYYVSSANLGLLESWLKQDMPYSPTYMARQITRLTTLGPLKAAGIM